MILYEELYFEITFTGSKSEIKKFASFLKSGGLDDFIELGPDYISYDDGFDGAAPEEETSLTLSNDDYGIEIDEFDTDEFLEVLCRAAKGLDVSGQLYDIDDEEFSFKSEAGDSYYVDASKIERFNEDDDLDEAE